MDATPVQEPDRALPASQRQVLVLDLSRSMRAPLPDPAGPEREKIEIARSAVGRIVRHAQSSRSAFGLVSFNDAAKVVLPLGLIKRADIARIDGIIADLEPDGRS
ncbi:MAG: VWA domain-containing protein, partial [Thermoplasmata archaeon]|nr:VWA domain-containing protein [Thermoplasmata archaeon]